MTRTSAALLLTLVSIARSAAADDDTAATARATQRPDSVSEPGPAHSTWGTFCIGVAEAPYFSATLGEVRSDAGQARLLRFGGAVHVTGATWVGAAVAHAMPGVEQPAGSYRAARAWGNPMLFGESSHAHLADSIASGLEGRLRFGIGLPLAGGGQLGRRALAIADALEGMSEPELFTPDVLPLVVGGSLILHGDSVRASVGLKLPLLLRLSDESIPDGATTTPIGFAPGANARVTVWPLSWLGASLSGTLVWPLVRPVYLSRRGGPPQAMVSPRLLFAIGPWVLIALDVDVAAGGPLSGTASAALGARVAFE
jgi:hypothetical protein